MKYKPEDIKPKRYSSEVANNSGTMWIQRDTDKEWISVGIESGYPCYKGILWFIDIPGAPPELKPLEYPQNKPDEDGMYWVHRKNSDDWARWFLDKDTECGWDAWVDYFIPYRLDRKDDEMETNYCDFRDDGGVMQIVMDWDNKTKEVHLRKSDLDKGEAVRIFSRYLADVGYDVTKRQPEIKACPYCGGECYTWNPDENEWSVACHDCTYNSGCADSESEAIRLHNLIARKGE